MSDGKCNGLLLSAAAVPTALFRGALSRRTFVALYRGALLSCAGMAEQTTCSPVVCPAIPVRRQGARPPFPQTIQGGRGNPRRLAWSRLCRRARCTKRPLSAWPCVNQRRLRCASLNADSTIGGPRSSTHARGRVRMSQHLSGRDGKSGGS